MRQLTLLTLAGLIIFQSYSLAQTDVIAQQEPRPITEQKSSQVKTIIKEAPQECLTISKEFIAYIHRNNPDIGKDKEAQNRWLSKSLREGFVHQQEKYNELLKNKIETPDLPPGNRDFLGTWDYPTTYKIEGSRVYKERAIVDINFFWGKGTNYEGDTRLVSYVFKREGNKWKLDDIYTFEGEFISASSLIEEFNHPNY